MTDATAGMTSGRRVGIMGGTFDPIHRGHMDLGCAAESAIGLTRLCLLPVNIPPHRAQPFASSYHRFAMVALAVSGHARWQATDLELQHPTPSYTSSTLDRLHRHGYAPSELFFVIGADSFAEIETWKDYPAILDGANFAVVSRPGCSIEELPRRLPLLSSRMARAPITASRDAEPLIILIDAMTANVSSTAIRMRRASGEPITGLVDPRVEQHIEQHGLYSFPTERRRGADRPLDEAAGGMHG